MRHIYRAVVVMVIAGILSSCASHGGTNDPLIRPFQWFSYANGDDIRAACEPGRSARYRLIYNAMYDEQVRTYDIVQISKIRGAIQTTRVFSGDLSANWILNSSGNNPAANPSVTNHSRADISLQDLVDIEQALIHSGFEKPAIKGQILHSDSFYWIAMVCRDGQFKYYAWNDENADVAKLPFRKVLSKGDKTGVPFLEPYVPTAFGRGSRYYNGRQASTYFTMEIGDNGLVR